MTVNNHIDPFFEIDLGKFKYAQFSVNPNIPLLDEEVKHEIRGHQMIATKEGTLILLDLVNTQTGEQYVHAYSEVIDIEANSSSSADFAKYYITCLNKAEVYNLRESRKMLEKGISLSEDDAKKLEESYNQDLEHLTYRILLVN